MQAPIEFNAIVHAMASRYCPLGYDIGRAPRSLDALQTELAQRNRFTVNGDYSDNTIFSEREFNLDFRAWHDATHYAIGAEFDLVGETAVAIRQIDDLATVYGTRTANRYRALILAEVVGQALAYEFTGRFPSDQPQFDRAFINAMHCGA